MLNFRDGARSVRLVGLVFVVASLAATGCSARRGSGAPGPGSGQSDGGTSDDGALPDATASHDAIVDMVVADTRPPFMSAPSDVDVAITADNAYSFGYGTESGIDTYFAGSRATSAGEIFSCPIDFGPEHYVVPAESAPPGAYLYIVSWDDHSVTQGVLAQFKRTDATLYSGDTNFEVCATGIDFTTASGPTQEQVNTEILNCNAGTGDPATSSAGWVNTAGPVDGTPSAVGVLAVGEANEPNAGPGDYGVFPQVCVEDADGNKGIEEGAHWMWYDPQDGSVRSDAFHSSRGNAFRAFLIFRLPADSIVIF